MSEEISDQSDTTGGGELFGAQAAPLAVLARENAA